MFPFAQTKTKDNNNNVDITEIPVHPLTISDVATMLTEILETDAEEESLMKSAALTTLKRMDGILFYISQYLPSLEEDNILKYDVDVGYRTGPNAIHIHPECGGINSPALATTR
eukprot:scaffold8628_cov149-Amphora_coffeaeformis.AAC.5